MSESKRDRLDAVATRLLAARAEFNARLNEDGERFPDEECGRVWQCRQSEGGYADMSELQTEFLIGFLNPFLAENHAPLMTATDPRTHAWKIEKRPLVAWLHSNAVDRTPVKARRRFMVVHRPGAARRERWEITAVQARIDTAE